jgi:hypothetical protein
MNQTPLMQFGSTLQHGNPLKDLWKDFSPYINNGKVESRDQAYVLFSKALKISQETMKHESLKQLWLEILAQGGFSLCLDNKEPIHYRFNTIIDLMNSGREAFEVNVVEVDPKNSDLPNIAEAIHSIALSSLGNSPGASLFQTVISSPNTMCLLAKERETFIACTYGSYLQTAQTKFFHLNFLGRLVEYPSIHILEKLQLEANRIKNRFPEVQYITLCTSATNDHMIPIYKTHGFEEIEYIEAGFKNEPTYFFAKKLDPNTTTKAPSYLEYKSAIEAERKNRTSC